MDPATLPALTIKTIKIGHLKLRVGRRPSHNGSGTTLILLGGLGSNIEMVEPFLDALDDVNILIPEMPGSGDSTATRLPNRMKSLAHLIEKVLEHEHIHEQIDIAGMSWGGMLAQEYSYRYPKRCRKLILAATIPLINPLPAHWSKLKLMATGQLYKSKDHLFKVAPTLYGGMLRNYPYQMQELALRMKKPNNRGYLNQVFSTIGWTSMPWLYTLKPKTLILAGDDDPLVPLAYARTMRWLIPQSRLRVIHGGGHLFPLTQANQTASIIKHFISK